MLVCKASLIFKLCIKSSSLTHVRRQNNWLRQVWFLKKLLQMQCLPIGHSDSLFQNTVTLRREGGNNLLILNVIVYSYSNPCPLVKWLVNSVPLKAPALRIEFLHIIVVKCLRMSNFGLLTNSLCSFDQRTHRGMCFVESYVKNIFIYQFIVHTYVTRITNAQDGKSGNLWYGYCM